MPSRVALRANQRLFTQKETEKNSVVGAKPGQVCPISPVSHVFHDLLVRGPGQSRVRVIAPTDLQEGEADDFCPQLVEEGIAGVQIWNGVGLATM